MNLNDTNKTTTNRIDNKMVFSFTANKHFVLRSELSQHILPQIPPCQEQQPDVENIIILY